MLLPTVLLPSPIPTRVEGNSTLHNYVQVSVSYILIVAFAAFFLLLIRALRAEEDGDH